ncbi:MAG: MFS transporter [Propionibacteriales bacterium]|nr:MFS transporter [Propionibacteriales bacterium]
MTWEDSFRPFANSGFRYFIVGRTVMLFGNAMAPVAVAFAVLHIGGGPSGLGLVLAARSIPQVVFLLFGGVIADRFARHHVLIVAGTLSGVAQAGAAALVISGNATVAGLMVIEAIQGIVAAFTFPAMQAMVPLLIPERDQWQQANALAAAGRTMAFMVGPAVGGILVATVGAGWGLGANAMTYLVGAAVFARLRLASRHRAAPMSMIRELSQGWSEFVSRTWVWVVVLAFGVLNAIHAGAWFTLGPVIADSTFGPDGWGLVLAAEGAGAMVGIVLLLRLRWRHPMRVGMLGAAVLALPMAVLGWSPGVLILALAALLAGVGLELFSVNWETSLQQHVPIDRLSRVASYDALGSFVALPVGQVIAGPLAGLVDVRRVVIGGAILYAVVAVATMAVPAVWRLTAGTAEPVPENVPT